MTVRQRAVLMPARGCECDSCPFYLANPAAAEPMCSGCNTDCAYCSCSRAEAANPHPAPCGQCPIRCGSRSDIHDWMGDVGGTLTFDDVDLADLELPAGLPRYIPQVDTKELAELDAELGWPAYAVGLRRVFSPATWQVMPGYRDRTAAQALGLRAGQLAVLVCYGKDPLVEAFWTRRWQLAEQLAAQAWDLVLAPNFSAYGNFPRAEQLLNYRRNLLIAQELGEAGVPAVPNIYSFRLEDLQRYEAWLQRTEPPAVAVNLQTQRSDDTFYQLVLPGLIYLGQALPETTKIIVTGSSRSSRIGELLEIFDHRLHLVSQNALLYARHGAVMTSQGRRDVHAYTADAFAANVRHYAALLDGAATGTAADGEPPAPSLAEWRGAG